MEAVYSREAQRDDTGVIEFVKGGVREGVAGGGVKRHACGRCSDGCGEVEGGEGTAAGGHGGGGEGGGGDDPRGGGRGSKATEDISEHLHLQEGRAENREGDRHEAMTWIEDINWTWDVAAAYFVSGRAKSRWAI